MSAKKKTAAPAAKKTAAKKTAAKKTAAKKTAAKKTAAKKTAAKKTALPAPKMKQAALKNPVRSKKKSTALKEGGLVLPDPGFHLAVMGALLDKGEIAASDLTAALQGIDGDEETERLVEGLGRLHAMALDPAAVAKIESIDFDGGNEIYMTLEDGCGTETGGEDDTYELRSLEGIGALTSLSRLRLDGHGYRVATLKPLAGLPALADITLCGKCAGAKALESLPKLARVDARRATVSDAAVLDRLAKRGVEIVRKEE